MTADKAPAAAPSEIDLYKAWEESGAFSADNGSAKKPFTIMIPPPNVTGNLHTGHALTMTIQDVFVRWKRMQQFDALWLPGTDHAGIATQLMVERQLQTEGKTRQELGREGFLERVWKWKEESGGSITKQLRRLGASLDWKRERFTMDEGLSDAVRKAFITLYDQGLIYRDRRLVNWDPKFQSAVSDLEVENKETKGSLWYIRYPVEGAKNEFITVATTRPETLLGDMAVAVNPQDERYKHLVGKNVIVPIIGRAVPVVADDYSDMEKGTGAVKITPAHDFNDFNVGQRHKLAMPSVLDKQANITLEEISADARDVAGVSDGAFLKSLAGLERFVARKKIIVWLEEAGLMEKIEPHVLQVPHAQRGNAVIEPYLTTQWYCNAGHLAKPAIAAVETGKIKFVPEQWENTFYAWMNNIQPWCISRQLWWGHRIPAWYGPDGHVFVCDNEAAANDAAQKHYGTKTKLTRDEDVLDTWFSSALWPFSTLGWPNETPDLKRYYPGDVLVTGFDIIFFWVARMMMMGLHFMGDVPFHTVFMHGLVTDEHGQKMSKTKGNVLDPIDMIDKYGADALRWTVCSVAGPGRNMKLSPTRIETSRSFISKIRSAANFCEYNKVKPVPGFDPSAVKSPLCRWLLAETNKAIDEATTALNDYRLDLYAEAMYRFTWNVFCDWFIEFSKPGFNSADNEELRATAGHVLGIMFRLLHPAVPFVTEELWQKYGYNTEGDIIGAPWPVVQKVADAEQASDEINFIIRLISSIRAIRSEMNIPHSLQISVLLRDATPAQLALAQAWQGSLKLQAKVSELTALTGDVPKGSAQAVIDNITVILPLEGIIDLDAERTRLDKEITKIQANIEKLTAQLSNESFVARAPANIVEDNRNLLANMKNEIDRLQAAKKQIKG